MRYHHRICEDIEVDELAVQRRLVHEQDFFFRIVFLFVKLTHYICIITAATSLTFVSFICRKIQVHVYSCSLMIFPSANHEHCVCIHLPMLMICVLSVSQHLIRSLSIRC
jgi:hypothetical protein